MESAGKYRAQLEREAKHWGDRLKVETVEASAWLDHPVIADHYRHRATLDDLSWDRWVAGKLGGAADKSMELGCGSAGRSIQIFDRGLSKCVEGLDASPDRIAEGERERVKRSAPGRFVVADANTLELAPNSYDLIFSCHSFHHFTALEHVMAQVHAALTPRGYFVLEEFVGPTQFQWTKTQIDVVKTLMSLLPERLRRLRWNAIKSQEGRPRVADVVAVSPFESIRSGEIVPLFEQYFQIAAVRLLGGTLQHLLYNGIVHNFAADDAESLGYLKAIYEVEDALVDGGLIPSDFQLLIGRRRAD